MSQPSNNSAKRGPAVQHKVVTKPSSKGASGPGTITHPYPKGKNSGSSRRG